MRSVIAAASWAALAAGCSYSLVQAMPSGPGIQAEPRPSGCHLDFYRTRPPERPYDEIAALHIDGGMLEAAEAQEAMRAKACELGAHAIVVTREYALGAMSGTAVVYRGFRAADAGAVRPPPPPPAPPSPCPPGGKLVPASLRQAAEIRERPGRDAPALRLLAEGTVVCASDWSDRGFRQVFLEGNRNGWVPEEALAFSK